MSRSPSSSPVVANWELVLRLRRRRDELGLGIQDVAAALGFTRNYWSAIENERKLIPISTLRPIFDVLKFDSRTRQELLELHKDARSVGWWTQYSTLLDSDLQRLYGLEDGARRICDFEPLLIPGLLQTADYARTIMQTTVTVAPVEVEQRIAIRMRRQVRLSDENPLELQVLLCEAALHQQIGGISTLRGQLDHLLMMIERHPKTIDVRVIPFTAGACTLFGGGTLSLLEFHSPHLPPTVWSETVSNWGFVTGGSRVRDTAIAFAEALGHALDRRDTIRKISECRKELR